MKPRLIILIAALALACLIGWPAVGQAASEPLTPKDLAVYYGWPSLVNGSTTNAAAAAVFGQYDVVVFNQGLEEAPHGDHANTQQIITLLHQTYGTKVYGYINGPQWGTSWSRSDLPPANWEAHLDMWVAMGVDGIFIDEFGYDWKVTRVMQNAMLDAVHTRGLPAFVNAWFIDHAFSSQPDPVFPNGNPAALASHITANDLYLLESFAIMQGVYDVCERPVFDTFITKGDKARAYRAQFGTQMWTMTTSDKLAVAAAGVAAVDPRLSYAWHATAMYGLDGFGWTEDQFSASGPAQNLLPWRERPNPNPPAGTGTVFMNAVQHAGATHTRHTDTGEFKLVCNDAPSIHTAQFIVSTCPIKRYDFNFNNAVDVADIGEVATRWMDPTKYNVLYDISPAGQPDGVIDISDIALIAVHWNESCP